MTSQPAFRDFSVWIAEALEEANLELIKVRSGIVFKDHFVNKVLNDPGPFLWSSRVLYLQGPFYELYLQHSKDFEAIQKNLESYRLFWRFARASSDLMKLPFFQKLYSEPTVSQSVPESMPESPIQVTTISQNVTESMPEKPVLIVSQNVPESMPEKFRETLVPAVSQNVTENMPEKRVPNLLALQTVLNQRFGPSYSKLISLDITPKIFSEATYKELKWVLRQNNVTLKLGEKLMLLKIHRDYVSN